MRCDVIVILHNYGQSVGRDLCKLSAKKNHLVTKTPHKSEIRTFDTATRVGLFYWTQTSTIMNGSAGS